MLIEPFLDYLRLEKNCSEKTIVSYGTDLTKFEEFFKSVDEEIDFTTVDADVIRLWVVSLMDGGYTSTSVNRKLSSLRSFYRYLLRKKIVAVVPPAVRAGAAAVPDGRCVLLFRRVFSGGGFLPRCGRFAGDADAVH